MRMSSPRTPDLVAGLVLMVDQLTKWWVLANFKLYESSPVITGFFDLTFVTNTGAAFGMLAGEQNIWRQIFFVSMTLTALVVLCYAFRHYRQAGKLYVLAIGLVSGGALGNLVDRLRFGHVVDFLDFYIKGNHWPAFNVADSAITVGVAFFLLAGYLDNDNVDPDDQQDGSK
jgi:signal peptidase II